MTEGLRARLEQKARRRIVVPLQVSDPGEALEALQATVHRRAVLELTGRLDADEVATLDTLRAQAQAEVDGHYLLLELSAMSPADWEALIASHPPLEDSQDSWDWDAVLPEALAACCSQDVDQPVDAEWWAEQLESTPPRWTWAERNELRSAIVHLHGDTPGAFVPKG